MFRLLGALIAFNPKPKHLVIALAIGFVCLAVGLLWTFEINREEQTELAEQFANEMMNRAYKLHSKGQLSAANSEYLNSLKLKPVNADAYVCLADIEFKRNNIQKSLELADKGLQIDPNNIVGLANRAQALLRLHQNQAAIDAASDALLKAKLQPNPSLRLLLKNVYLIRSTAYSRAGMAQKAAWDLDSARLLMHQKHHKESDCATIETKFKQKITRRRFILCANSTADAARNYADLVEVFLTYVDQHIYKLKPDFNVHIFIYQNEADYEAYLKKENFSDKPKGNFDLARNALFTSSDGDFGTFAHVMMHKVIEDITFLDEWAKEGIPTVFEKIYGYKTGDSYSFVVGVQNPVHIKVLGNTLKQLPLIDAVSTVSPQETGPQDSLLAVFLFKLHKIKEYLTLCETGPNPDYSTAVESLFRKPATEMLSVWSAYLTDIDKHRAEIEHTPNSQIFATKAEYDNFAAKTNLHRLVDIGNIESLHYSEANSKSVNK